ncbi:tubby C-terminal domain-like protein [Lysinibacillus sphaericus]
MYSSGIVPSWFYLMVIIIFILFVGVGYWVTRAEKGLKTGGDGKIAEKAIFYENRFRNSQKPAEIIDVKTNYAGSVQRIFTTRLQQIHALFSPRNRIMLIGKNHDESLEISVNNIRGKGKFLHSSWEAEVGKGEVKERFKIYSYSERRRNINLSFPYKGEMLAVSSDLKDGVIRFHNGNREIALITFQRKLPPRKVFIDAKDGELPVPMLAVMFEIVKYYD